MLEWLSRLKVAVNEAVDATKFLQLVSLTEQYVDEEQNCYDLSGFMSETGTSRDEAVIGFFQWFRNFEGVFVTSSIEPVEINGTNVFGIRAMKTIELGESLCKVPTNLMLTASCENCPSLRKFCHDNSLLSRLPNLRLALNLLNERLGHESFLRPYINALPKAYMTSVIYFNAATFEKLKPSPAFSLAARLYRSLLSHYLELHEAISASDCAGLNFDAKSFSFSAFRWSIGTVLTRQNSLPVGDGLALIPVLDFFNHNTVHRPSVDFDDSTSQAVVYSPDAVAQGEEICIFYGPRSNYDLLIHNGFALNENPFDCYHLDLAFDRSKSQLLSDRFGILQSSQSNFLLSLKDSFPESLHLCLLVQFASDEHSHGASNLAELLSKMEKDAKKKAYAWLVTQVFQRLKQYPQVVKATTDLENFISMLHASDKRILQALVNELRLLLK